MMHDSLMADEYKILRPQNVAAYLAEVRRLMAGDQDGQTEARLEMIQNTLELFGLTLVELNGSWYIDLLHCHLCNKPGRTGDFIEGGDGYLFCRSHPASMTSEAS